MIIRLITLTLGGEGYLTFMGNEFGHPEWIDFPREGNGWSYHYCRRQWSLAMNQDLRYHYLDDFEKAMIAMVKKYRVVSGHDHQLLVHNGDKVMAYTKGKALFVYNLHPTQSFEGYQIPVAEAGEYKVVMSTDDFAYGGFGRIHHETYTAKVQPDGRLGFQLYLPARTAMVLVKK